MCWFMDRINLDSQKDGNSADNTEYLAEYQNVIEENVRQINSNRAALGIPNQPNILTNI